MEKRTLLFICTVIALGGFLNSSSANNPRIALLERLASPEMEGRGVGTAGLGKACDLLVDRFKASGLKPAFVPKEGPASYLQEFRVFVGNELGSGNAFFGKGAPDFIPLAFSRSGELAASSLVFAGFGISLRGENGAPSAYDDYAGLDVHGKIVLVLTGDPGTGNRDSLFRNPAFYTYSTPMYKVQNAQLHGAAGIVLVRDPLSLSGPEPSLRFQPRQGGGATSEILAGQISISFADILLGASGKLRSLQEKIAKEQKPSSLVLEGQGSFKVALTRQLGAVQNVAAVIPGNEPLLAKEYIVIGAHYDHLGYGGDNSLDPDGLGKIHFGADDNASGVQAVVDIAERIHLFGARRPVLVVLFSAEEVGLLGSAEFVNHLPIPESASVVAMINLDMVGRLQQNRLSVMGLKSAKEFSDLVDRANMDAGFVLAKGDSGFGSSDHASFLRAKIPSVFFTTGAHGDYHRPSDIAEKIEAAGLERVEEIAYSLWREIDERAEAPTYDPSRETPDQPPRDGRGYGAYFGSIPDFEQGELAGVLLQGVRPDSPAAKAGLQTGDILTGLGEINVRNLQDLVFALRYYRPNEEVLVRWQRQGKEMSAEAVLQERSGH
ncbi:MAG TPA: M28 family peptidase [Bdellovibrionota bacterium]|jgi:hypothetical protein